MFFLWIGSKEGLISCRKQDLTLIVGVLVILLVSLANWMNYK